MLKSLKGIHLGLQAALYLLDAPCIGFGVGMTELLFEGDAEKAVSRRSRMARMLCRESSVMVLSMPGLGGPGL
jgi:hypothetical protein